MAKAKKRKSIKGKSTVKPKRKARTRRTLGSKGKRTLAQINKLDKRLIDMDKAWDAVVNGLGDRAKERYESAIKKLGSLRTSLKELAIVDMVNVGKVLRKLNSKVNKKVSSKETLKMKDLFQIEDIFKDTSNAVDAVLDSKAVNALVELQGRMQRLFKARIGAMKEVNSKVKARFRSAMVNTKKLRNMVPRADGALLEKISRFSMSVLENVADLSIEKVRTRRKDMEKLARGMKDLDKKLASALKKMSSKKGSKKGEQKKGKG